MNLHKPLGKLQVTVEAQVSVDIFDMMYRAESRWIEACEAVEADVNERWGYQWWEVPLVMVHNVIEESVDMFAPGVERGVWIRNIDFRMEMQECESLYEMLKNDHEEGIEDLSRHFVEWRRVRQAHEAGASV